MLIQALAEYADDRLGAQLDEKAWEPKPVPYLLAFDRDGTFLNVIDNYVHATRGQKTVSVPGTMHVPRSPVPRNAGLYPLLAADDIKYVLGTGPWTKEEQIQNHQDRHDAFLALIRRAAIEVKDESLVAAVNFYARPDQVEAARSALAKAKPGNIVALCLSTTPLVMRLSVRAHWSKLYAAAASDRVANTQRAECLISGKIGPIAPTHEKIKGLGLGGQSSGISLMSFDKEAFRSYGWEQCANSPVAPDRAMAYVLALNDLLKRDDGQRRDIAGIAFVFWTKKKTDFDPMAAVEQADPAQVQRLLALNTNADPDPNMFYMAGFGANGGRMLLRYWVAETLDNAKRNIADWRNQLRMANAYTGEIADAPPLWQLRNAIDREGEPPADRTLSLFKRAIEGEPLGYKILAAALSRLRVAKSSARLDAARAGLIRVCINDHIRSEGERELEPHLDPGQKQPAYLCGRLMAIFERLQYAASGEVNQTVADRYFSLASTYPALAFPKLEDLGRKHLRKLRRDKPGAMVRILKAIDELCLEIEQASGFKFPDALDLDGQGRFALGYHHQRAHDMAQAKSHSALHEDLTIQENTED